MKRWNKKGQLFLLIAIVIILITFPIIAEYNTIRVGVALEDFNELSQGYTTESPKVINAALFSGKNPVSSLNEFTNRYLDYARQKEPNYGILYTYRDEAGKIHIVNTLNNAVLTLEFTDPTLGQQVQLSLPCDTGPNCEAPGSITINIGGIPYTTSVTTPESSYGGQFSNIKTLEGITNLVITYPGGVQDKIFLTSTTYSFQTATLITGTELGSSGSFIKEVSVTRSPDIVS